MDKIFDANLAARAYGNISKMPVAQGAREVSKTGGDGDGDSFAGMVQKAARDSVDTMKAGEKMAARAVTDQADLTDVVQAVTASEITLQTVVSLRDRMISAYQEIMRMPI